MANVSSYLAKILSAVYGEEVRGAIHDAIDAMNTESSSAMSYAKTAQDSATESASAASQSASAAKTSETDAKASETKVATSASNAKTSETNAGTSASSAATSASNAKTSETNAKTYQTNAATSASNAKTSETNAKTYQTNAATSASNAKTSETNAATSASNAKTSETNAGTSAKTAQSWAAGGTGTRTGEDTDNAKYWAEKAKSIAGGSFDPEGSADAVQSNLDTHTADTVKHITAAERTAWNAKQSALTFDTTPTSGSTKPVTSGGVKTALDAKAEASALTSHTGNTTVHITAAERTAWNAKQNALTFDTTPVTNSTNPVTSGGVYTALSKKQDASTAITMSNIGSQTVNKATYATGTIAVGTAALRNQYFVSAEATPTINGQIAWVYG